jgi:large subunit ribosomal protein L31
MKKDIHPKWYPDAKVICNGEQVMTVGAAVPEMHVEVWSGTHPFYTGQQRIVDTEGQVERFVKRLERREGMAVTSKKRKTERRREKQAIAEYADEEGSASRSEASE